MGEISLLHLCYGGEGGQVAAARLLLDGLSKSDIKSAVVTVAPASEMLESHETWPEKIPVSQAVVRRRLDLASMLEVGRAVLEYRPRIILCHSLRHVPAAFVGQLLGRMVPRLVIVEHHSTDLRSATDNLRSALALLFSHGIIFLTNDAARRYPLRNLPLPGLRWKRVIPHGIAPRSNPSRNTGKITVIGMAARMVDSKDYDTLLRGFATIKSEPSNEKWMLKIAGSGPNQGKIIALIDALNLNTSVELVGNVASRDMPDFFSKLDLYVHCTWGENLSLSLLEAASWGLPIVASDVNGVNGVFSQGVDAILVRPGDTDALADAIISAKKSAHLLGHNAQLMVRKSFSLETMVTAYCKFFADIDPKGPWSNPSEGVNQVPPTRQI